MEDPGTQLVVDPPSQTGGQSTPDRREDGPGLDPGLTPPNEGGQTPPFGGGQDPPFWGVKVGSKTCQKVTFWGGQNLHSFFVHFDPLFDPLKTRKPTA